MCSKHTHPSPSVLEAFLWGRSFQKGQGGGAGPYLCHWPGVGPHLSAAGLGIGTLTPEVGRTDWRLQISTHTPVCPGCPLTDEGKPGDAPVSSGSRALGGLGTDQTGEGTPVMVLWDLGLTWGMGQCWVPTPGLHLPP